MAGHGLVYAVKKALMAALGWNLLLLVKRLMRDDTKEPVFGLIRTITGLIRVISVLTAYLQIQSAGKTPANAQCPFAGD